MEMIMTDIYYLPGSITGLNELGQTKDLEVIEVKLYVSGEIKGG
tara:strand:+ start:426 stop:557 length:132 start_codon:yes stop_codon:yes gene_type:complete